MLERLAVMLGLSKNPKENVGIEKEEYFVPKTREEKMKIEKSRKKAKADKIARKRNRKRGRK